MQCNNCQQETKDYCDKQDAYYCVDCDSWTMAEADDINKQWEVAETDNK